MSYIIDGHNLIGVLPDIQLNEPEDERRLLTRLRAFRARTGGRPMIVFFDSGDLPAQLPDLSSPGVQARFAGRGQTADDAIVEYLRGRKEPGQYAVVTNDQDLARRVREIGASVLPARDFAAKLAMLPRSPDASDESSHDPHDAAFADIHAHFIAAEKAKTRFASLKQNDPAIWIERLDRGDPQLAAQAARWLGQCGDAAALEPLRVALLHDDAGVRAAACLALGDLGNPTALPELCDRLARDGNSMVREAAAQSLGRVGNRTVETALQAAAQADPKGKVRKAAAVALRQIQARRGTGKQGNK